MLALDREAIRPHRVVLVYTNDDDGIHLQCSCDLDVNLGFFPALQDALIAEATHLNRGNRAR